jgi:hypothetical protein
MASRCRRCGAFLIVVAACGTPAWPREPWPEIERALGLTLVEASDDSTYREFRSTVAAAGEAMSEEECSAALASETVSMQHKLLAIAAYRHLRPDLFTEVTTYYSPSTTARAMVVPDLDHDHATESYRLVWEYHLLAPRSWFAEQSAQALGLIANPASILTLRDRLKAGRAPLGSYSALAQIPCREAAEAVAEILGKTGRRPNLPSIPEETLPGGLLVEKISGLTPEKRARWLALLGDMGATHPAVARFSRAVQARVGIDRAVELTYLIPERVTAEAGAARLVRGRIDMVVAHFDAALTAGAEAPDSDGLVVRWQEPRWRHAKDGIVTWMREIAVDRVHRRRRYQELQRTYVQRKETHPLRREHVSESYRLAWELLLVMPVSSDASSEFRSRAAEAIGAIGNPDSVTILAHAIDVLAGQDVPPTSPGNEAQRRLMAALLRMPPSAEVAEAISTALRHIGFQQKEYADKGGLRWDAKTYVVDVVVGMPAPARDAWLAVTDLYWPDYGELRARLKQDGR